jgi:NitT/TauT family transport system permease protein
MLRSPRLGKALAAALALLAWQAAAMAIGQELLLVSPSKVALRLFALIGEAGFWKTVLFSFARIISGFLLALAAGSLLAAAAGRLKAVETLLWPWVITIKSVPVASFIILCLIWLSSRQLPVFIAFLMVFPVVYSNLLEGIKCADSKLLEMARLFKVPLLRRVKYIYLPHLRPFVLSACGVGLGLAWKAGVTAEIIGIPGGSIGERLYEAKVYLDTADLFAWTVVIVLVSVAFEKVFLRLLTLLIGGKR